jgi:hypothetical protein
MPTPFTLHREVRQVVEPHALDRLAFSIGFDDVSEEESPRLLYVEVRATTDGPSKSLPLGVALLASPIPPPGYFMGQTEPIDHGCPGQSLDKLQEFLALPGARSKEFSDMLAEIKNWADAWPR